MFRVPRLIGLPKIHLRCSVRAHGLQSEFSTRSERRVALRKAHPQSMNTPRILLLLLLTAGIRAQAQDNPNAAPAQTEMQKWIATTDAQWQATFKREVTDVREAELNKLKL